MKKWLHKKFGWFECMFNPFDTEPADKGEVISCRWCGKKYKLVGIRHLDGKLVLITP